MDTVGTNLVAEIHPICGFDETLKFVSAAPGTLESMKV